MEAEFQTIRRGGSKYVSLAWVWFPTLPLENFDDTSLLSIGNAVGTTIKVDRNNVDTGRGRYARVCVELKLNQPLVPNVLVLGRKQLVEYEGLPKICFKCGCHGHIMENCGTTRSDKSAANSVVGDKGPDTTTRGSVENPFGPWMLPA